MLATVLEVNIEEDRGEHDDVVVIRPRLTGNLLLRVHLLSFIVFYSYPQRCGLMPDPPGYQERLRQEEDKDSAERRKQAAEFSERRRLAMMEVLKALEVLEAKLTLLIRPG